MIRNIRLVEDDAEHIEGNSEKIKGLVLKTCFLRRPDRPSAPGLLLCAPASEAVQLAW